MYALNAFITKSKLSTLSANNPDLHGGFELGTWDIISYSRCFAKLVGYKADLYQNKIGKEFGVDLYQCDSAWRKKVLEGLKSFKKTEDGFKVPYEEDYKNDPFTLGGLTTEWYNKLVGLFESEDLVFIAK